MSRLARRARARGVVAPSSGNHAQAVAWRGPALGRAGHRRAADDRDGGEARLGAERLGARIVLAGTTTEERVARARELSASEGSAVVHSFDDARIIAGQGTIGLEILEELPDLAEVVVPVGGGGLAAGVAAAIRRLRPQARVIGVEPEGAPKLSRALDAGQPVRLERTTSIADALLAAEVGRLPFRHLQRGLHEVRSVDDDGIVRAMRLLLDRAKLVVEPAGAITAAAVLARPGAHRGPTVVVLSGGNVEWEDLRRTLVPGAATLTTRPCRTASPRRR